jgi:hypothetical protein
VLLRLPVALGVLDVPLDVLRFLLELVRLPLEPLGLSLVFHGG